MQGTEDVYGSYGELLAGPSAPKLPVCADFSSCLTMSIFCFVASEETDLGQRDRCTFLLLVTTWKCLQPSFKKGLGHMAENRHPTPTKAPNAIDLGVLLQKTW